MKLNVKLFADGADKDDMLEMYANPLISGFTTNPYFSGFFEIKIIAIKLGI